ncbi:glycogen phosphorylase [Gilliamella sp. wkB178]|uniref:glycogen/starch/alpha-glucan family phosphorylase n=1 Tax=Gilliamella sp. wkB178 TaxID=3120259 RepID=UPI00080ED968|nr:glycogen/starch/alpha-glucan family phosphorylase [Gilliamella apicola]OCG07805.1 glycogen phosphorylase [Gilliamella apicola]
MTLVSNLDYDSPVVTVEKIKQSIIYKLLFSIGRDPAIADKHDWLNAVILTVRDRMVEDWLRTVRAQLSQDSKQVYYLSMEFLIGRTLSNSMISNGIYSEVKDALNQLGLDLEDLCSFEDDPGLGNGGLGRLAACFLDSLATLSYPGWGYGLRYEYGMFKQTIVDNQQVEVPDNWLKHGDAWEFYRHSIEYKVEFGGRVQQEGDITRWLDTEKVLAYAYDQIIPGYDNDVTNTLRLWSAKAIDELDLTKFNQGDYFAAVQDKSLSENVSLVLYPDDSTMHGKALRLSQEYFLVSATIQDIISRHYRVNGTVDNLVEKVAIHLNDTHPVLAIPEFIRILTDHYDYSFDKAWKMAQKIFSYTNHTLMSEALETWTVDMMSKVLPYHLQIIFKINYAFLEEVKKLQPNDNELLSRVSIIDEGNGRRVRMAWLAVIASHKVNGVSQLHSDLMVKSLFADFAKLYPEKFCNKTNGISPRRWVGVANPGLANLLDKYLSKHWRTNLNLLSELNDKTDYPMFLKELQDVKKANKERLTKFIADKLDIVIHPEALFDMQIKRIHEYKRQSLNLLHTIVRYNEILANPEADWVPRVVFFAGKAASAYKLAKQTIQLINEVATFINNDKRINGKLKVIFVPNYSVSLAEIMIPAADLSEQISLAGFEASGTSNMKFALNGSLIIGTLDGANVEIKESVGDDNIFIFGHNAKEVEELRSTYNPRDYYEHDQRINQALTQIATGYFSPLNPERYRGLFDAIANFGDRYQNLADFESYYQVQKKVDEVYRDPNQWFRKTAFNIANMGKFSSDRTIQEYAEDIWGIKPIKL